MTYVNNHSLPSPDYTGDSDSDSEVAKELEQKRREIDEEIAHFKALKDKEFREFEHDLKSRRRQRRAQQHGFRNDGINYYEFIKNSPSATPPSTSVLSACEKKHRSPSGQLQPIRLIKANASPKVTPPTICLDKMNVSKDYQPAGDMDHMQIQPPAALIPASARKAYKQRYASPSSTSSASVHSEARVKAPVLSAPPVNPTTSEVHARGMAVPNYLPLLDGGYDNNRSQVDGISTEPASPAEPSIMSVITAQSSSLPTESSLSESFQIPQTKRAYTSPTSTLNRAKLPPIIRNVNGRKHKSGKRKHVTFQLADRAIVEPSSSYEEGPSPDVDDESDARSSNDSLQTPTPNHEISNESPRPKFQRKSTPLDPFGRRRPTLKPLATPEEEVGMNMGDLLLSDRDDDDDFVGSVGEVDEDYFSPRHSNESPVRHASEQSWTPMNSPPKQRHSSLDLSSLLISEQQKQLSPRPYLSPSFSPHHSPGMRPARYPGMLGDDSVRGKGNVGFFELDEELFVDGDSEPKVDASNPLDDELEAGQKRRTRDENPEEEIKTGSSLPISIVRPGTSSVSNSWVGTFGH